MSGIGSQLWRETVMRSLRWFPMLMLMGMAGGSSPLRAQAFERPTGRSPTIYHTGPSWMAAAATVPTRIDLRWAEVTDALRYRVMRSSPSEPTPKMVVEIPGRTGDRDLAGKYIYHWDYLPPRSGGVTFTYTVYAVFQNRDGSPNLSTPSPASAVQALAPVAPSGLTSRVALSPIMGRLRVLLNWMPVTQATGYQVILINRPPAPPLPMPPVTTVKQASWVIDNVVPGQGGTVCVITLYEELLKDDTVRSCTIILTRTPS